MKKEDGSAGRRDVVEEGEEGIVGWLAKFRVQRRKELGWSGVKGLPAAGALEVGEGDARGNTEGPGAVGIA